MIDEEAEILLDHRSTDFSSLFGSELNLFLPYAIDSEQWRGQLCPLGIKHDLSDQLWAYRGFIDLLANRAFFDQYWLFWQQALENYQYRTPHPTYWYTNGCGQPIPRPDQWPQRAGTGYESVAGQLAATTELFNLFDGIVALTEVLARDKWVRQTFSF
jgi:hypothetical protein